MATGITLAFVGDVMLGRGVNEEILFRNDPAYFWGTTLPVLRSADIVIANLECAITTHKTIWQEAPKAFYFRADPRALDVLKAGNVKCVALANNHSLDFEEEGLIDTLHYLDSAGIHHAGAGRNLAEARAPAVIDVGGLKVGFLSATDNEPAFAANRHPGTNYFEITTEPATLGALEEAVVKAKTAGAVLVILSLHWGPNMVASPPGRFRRFAHAVLDLGVNIIHGHSAHIFQAVEVNRGNLIMYDTGDFLDDYAVDPVLRNDWSFVFVVETEESKIKKLKMIPVRLDFAQTNLAVGEEFEEVRDRMKSLCRGFDTQVLDIPEGLEVIP